MADGLLDRSADTALSPAARVRVALPALPALTLTRAQRSALALGGALAAIVLVQLPVLGYYFFNDDFVPLADITSRSTPEYIKDLLLLRDVTPNWRFLTGLTYLGEYRAFGLDAFPYFLIALLVHLATAGLIFWLVRRALESDWGAFLAAALFGVSAAPVPTLAQVTALNNVLGAFFVMLAIVLLYEGLDRGARPAVWLAASALAFAAAIASNESTMVVAPVFGLIVLWKLPQGDRWWREPRTWALLAAAALPFAVLGITALIGFSRCHCTEAGLYVRGNHIFSNIWIYLGRLLYPIGLEFPNYVHTAHIVAGSFVLALVALALVHGPALARVCAAFMLLAIAPHLPIEMWGAMRYTYLASVPFSILGAVLFVEAARYGRRLTPALPAVLAFLALAAIGLHGWQTWTQNETQARKSDDWRVLIGGLREAYPDVPPNTVVYIRGGPLTDPLAQCAVMPALAHVLWGNDRLLFTVPPVELQSFLVRPNYNVYVGDFAGGRIVPAQAPRASEADLQRTDVRLLPQAHPSARGNICAPGTPPAT